MTDGTSIRLPWHESETAGCEEAKLFGLFSTRARAEAAVDARRGNPGESNAPDGFEIAAYVLDRDAAWMDGYITVH